MREARRLVNQPVTSGGDARRQAEIQVALIAAMRFAAPAQPAGDLPALPDNVRRDAERYRALQREADRDYIEFGDVWYEDPAALDAAVDALLAAPVTGGYGRGVEECICQPPRPRASRREVREAFEEWRVLNSAWTTWDAWQAALAWQAARALPATEAAVALLQEIAPPSPPADAPAGKAS